MDYIIYTKKKGTTQKKDQVETYLFGSQQVNVGAVIGQEIYHDEESDLNMLRNVVEGKTIYDISTRNHGCCFAIDLETGSRGWYPGGIRVGDIEGSDVQLKSEPSDTSQTITTISHATVKILDVVYDANKEIWYQIKYREYTGYVRTVYISNIRYVDP